MYERCRCSTSSQRTAVELTGFLFISVVHHRVFVNISPTADGLLVFFRSSTIQRVYLREQECRSLSTPPLEQEWSTLPSLWSQ